MGDKGTGILRRVVTNVVVLPIMKFHIKWKRLTSEQEVNLKKKQFSSQSAEIGLQHVFKVLSVDAVERVKTIFVHKIELASFEKIATSRPTFVKKFDDVPANTSHHTVVDGRKSQAHCSLSLFLSQRTKNKQSCSSRKDSRTPFKNGVCFPPHPC